MAGIPAKYWQVCDRCGEIAGIASDDQRDFACAECGSTAAWEYTTQSKALTMQAQIRERVA